MSKGAHKMNTVRYPFYTILSTVNAPYREHIDADQLAECIRNVGEVKKYIGQVWGFFGEVPISHQITFAAHYSMSPKELQAAARRFSELSGACFKICEIDL